MIQGNVIGMNSHRADWSQTDATKPDFIKNKPDFATVNYVDGKHLLKTVNVPASGWKESGAGGYTQGITVAGILPTDTPHYGVVLSGTTEDMIAQRDAFALIDDLDTANSVITLTCLEEKPEIDLTIQLEVNR